MKYHLITFGCQMNAADSAWLARALAAQGFVEAPFNEAKIYIINTCAVREKPERKVFDVLGRIAEQTRRDPDIFAAVGGCVAQLAAKEIMRRSPLVRLVFGPGNLDKAPLTLRELADNPKQRLVLTDFTELIPERYDPFPETKLPSQAGVTIMQGCDNYCAYCIVPYARGPQKSRKSLDILRECRELLRHGASEIMLLGQNVNSYGQDSNGDGTNFVELLEQVAGLSGLRRLRFTTSHPKDLSDELIAALGRLPALCPALHLPLQSGSDEILRRMGRRYSSDAYLKLVGKLRQACPDIMLSTDFIVGFPGESEADFQATLEIVPRAGFDTAFSFMYSDRPGVAAERLGGKLSLEQKSERLARLQAKIEEQEARKLAARVGRVEEVLVEGRSKKQTEGQTSWRGRDPGGRAVNFSHPGSRDLTGSYIRVRITMAKRHSLRGEAEVCDD